MYLSRSFICVLLMMSGANVHAGLNKWVDENGVTHYGDTVPAQYANQKRTVLNERGMTVEKHKSAEELQAEEETKQKKQAVDKEKLIAERKKALRDRVLLDTFTTERDILISRDARLDAIDSQIQLTETLIKDNERKLTDLKKRIESLEKSGKEVPENMRKEVVSVDKQLKTNYQYAEGKTKEREGIIASFDEDIKRFRELKAAQKKK